MRLFQEEAVAHNVEKRARKSADDCHKYAECRCHGGRIKHTEGLLYQYVQNSLHLSHISFGNRGIYVDKEDHDDKGNACYHAQNRNNKANDAHRFHGTADKIHTGKRY